MTRRIQPDLIPPRRAAELLGVSIPTVTRAAQRGRLRSLTTPGGQRRFWESDVRAFRSQLLGDVATVFEHPE